jgi:hypothetical protein
MPRTAAENDHAPASAGWPVDAHVHLHALPSVPATLDAAAAHFARAAGGPRTLLGCLLLTQMAHERVFEALAGRDRIGHWRLRRLAEEPETMIASAEGRAVAVVCGRQVRAADGLEIAALGTLANFRDGRPFADSLAEVLEAGAIAAIPWGFGKWLGARGRRVEAALAERDAAEVFLADSGARSWATREPSLIRRARGRGARVLAGSDPFPFAADCRRAGSFGFLAGLEPDPERPLDSLRSWLHSPQSVPRLYGRPSGPFRFLVNQFGVQVHNRLRKDPALEKAAG